MEKFNTEYVKFERREDRSKFIASKFKGYLKGKILDVGCFNAPLRELLSDVEYIGIDIAGKPDFNINLEKIERLSFENSYFDIVLCIDVLEHLDNLHFVFSELVRVSKKYILISLPNCWCDARVPIERGRGSFAHYGLPPSKPIDRHKWFFNISEAYEFVKSKSKEFNLSIDECFVSEKPRNFFVRLIRKMCYPSFSYYNRYSNTLWILLKKSNFD